MNREVGWIDLTSARYRIRGYAVREPRLLVCLELFYHCGLRVGEAVRLQLRDLHESRTLQPCMALEGLGK